MHSDEERTKNFEEIEIVISRKFINFIFIHQSLKTTLQNRFPRYLFLQTIENNKDYNIHKLNLIESENRTKKVSKYDVGQIFILESKPKFDVLKLLK